MNGTAARFRYAVKGDAKFSFQLDESLSSDTWQGDHGYHATSTMLCDLPDFVFLNRPGIGITFYISGCYLESLGVTGTHKMKR